MMGNPGDDRLLETDGLEDECGGFARMGFMQIRRLIGTVPEMD
jgi:hypothetical protein